MRTYYRNPLLFAVLMGISVGYGYSSGRYWAIGDPLPTGDPWPSKFVVEVNANIEMKENVSVFRYSLLNPSKNTWPAVNFHIDIRKNPERHPFSRYDLSPQHLDSQHWEVVKNMAVITPTEVLSPTDWKTDGILPYQKSIWGNWDKPLMPGSSISGFGLIAEEPPGIREFTVGAKTDVFELDYSWPEERIDYYEDSIEYITEVNKAFEASGKTIAPVAPPEPFAASSWTLRMSEYAVEARKQKWIKTDKNLAEVKKLISGLNTGDIEKLRVAVKKIEAYVLAEKKKGNLTDEADALVRLNAQYLLRRLGSPAEKSYGETKP